MKPSKEERLDVIEAVKLRGYKSVKKVEKVSDGMFKTIASRNLGKTVYYGLIVKEVEQSYTVEVDFSFV